MLPAFKINHGLRYRQGTGFIRSLFTLLGRESLSVPDYTTSCRRQKHLPTGIEERLNRGENLMVGIDSTGLKVYGEGEWKVRKHGWSKRRTWRKLHVCTGLNTREILCSHLTGNDGDDDPAGEGMLDRASHRVRGFKGDGGYDKSGFREILGADVQQAIPPQKNAVIRLPGKGKPVPGHLIRRSETIEYIQKHGAKKWKQERVYHQRSLNEVVMFRYKTVFGGEPDARPIENQTTEVKLKCLLLNKFTGMGMPNSYKIA